MAVSADSFFRGAQPISATAPGLAFSCEPFADYIVAVDRLVTDAPRELPAHIGAELAGLLKHNDWLPAQYCLPGDDNYRRHQLYADPAGRFTVLSIVWSPGHASPVHGHTAWGVVGVYTGHPSVGCYRCDDQGNVALRNEFSCCPGDVSWVDAGIDKPHRIFNASSAPAITIHTYGRDLTEDPGCINILL